MSNVFASILATFITLPIFAFYLIYIVNVKRTKNKKASLKLAVDGSTILFVFSVYYIALEIWGESYFWLIITTVLLVAIIFTVIHWKLQHDIQLGKLFKGILRFNFLLFFVAYFLLSIYGLFVRIVLTT
ncbi:hypothetical protein BKP35_15035 [Anaerobacillus arseniciselenatis]|uniref:DUF3397 domain-containing protein n=1 Tax=Anaerobacillus arseniciselenatis TaxID=85682 RepID=A0A1S2LBC0_9BACI|nr:DUF3397 domain-containing protein [Anaerobacillus arseniciselenatis]OIJ09798.1 hypothetical protein BKP35_15035 [Anaerobacillus arseniciselenatis]